jgi:2-polyprenyl-3-methyl-5-hydroxy-6-metoxy-1,4-benzoquinol methylase
LAELKEAARLARAPVGAELLDDPDADPAVVAESLRNIARSNRWLGGWAAVRFGLERLLADQPAGARLTLLDIGTGAGDLPLRAARWAAARGVQLVPVGLERNGAAATLALRHGLPTAIACAGALPVRDRGVDIVLVSQLAHHLAPGEVARLVRACDRAARVGVVISDLRRSTVAALGFPLVARLLRFDPVTRVDGVTSIRRGYRPAELTALLSEGGVQAEVRTRPGWRIVAVWPAREHPAVP